MVRLANLPHNYPQLQNLIKRDPQSYREEFLQQYAHFKASMALISESTSVVGSALDPDLCSLITFLSHVASFYSESKSEFPTIIMSLLGSDTSESTASMLHPELRKTLVQAVLLLRKHKIIELTPILSLFLRLLRIQDKALRTLLYQSIVSEVRRANNPQRNNALNKSLQNQMYALLAQVGKSTDQTSSSSTTTLSADEQTLTATHQTLQIAIELYRRRVWDDARTVNVIADAATKQISSKVMTTALNFFVGRFRGQALTMIDNDDPTDPSADAEEPNLQAQYRDMLSRTQINGCKKSSKKKLKKHLAAMARAEEKKQNAAEREENNTNDATFAPIYLLHDPQGFIEKLFSILKKSNEAFEVKLLLINVISRVISAHKLVLIDFYSFLLRYIQPHQKEVTQILAFTAQASHDFIPPDVISPVIKAIADNFAAEYCSAPVIAAGINGLTAICRRCPLGMDADLLNSLVSVFKGYSDKGVVMATRGLVGLYRQVNPEMLHRRERGKEVSVELARNGPTKVKSYGQVSLLDASAPCHSNVDSDVDDVDDSFDLDDGSDLEMYSDEEADQDEVVDQEEEADQEDEEEEEEDTSPEKGVDIVRLAMTQALSPEQLRLLRLRTQGITHKTTESISDDEDCQDNSDSILVDPKSLESSKKSRQDYESRMESIKAGRQGRLKFGSRKGKHNAMASMSNVIKAKKTKNPIMMAHKPSVRAKKRRSLNEVRAVQKEHAKKQKLRH